MPFNELIFCIVNPGGGAVDVTLQANNMLATGSTFRLLAPDGTVREQWSQSAGNAGTSTHTTNVAAASLAGTVLAWTITVCSMHPAVVTGQVEILVTQDGVSCPITKDLFWHLEDVPQCDAEGDNTIFIRRKLSFRLA